MFDSDHWYNVYVCVSVYTDKWDTSNANIARELHSWRSLFQKSFPFEPSHDKSGGIDDRTCDISQRDECVCSLLSLLQVHAIYEVAAAILTNALLQMAGRGIVLVCFGGSSQGFYSLFIIKNCCILFLVLSLWKAATESQSMYSLLRLNVTQ